MPFTFHSDAGHGWLEVSLHDLHDVGVSLDQLSAYSYRQGDRLFLEEDCDAGVFAKAYEKKHGKFGITEKYQEHSFIRSLPRIM